MHETELYIVQLARAIDGARSFVEWPGGRKLRGELDMDVRARCSAGADRGDVVLNRRPSALRHRFAVCVLVLLALVMVVPASATSYVYDATGRLIAVTNDAGESARYVYDAMGNMLRVDRLAVGELALFSFTPGRGVSGMQVTLKGHAFSTEPTGNTVRFAGTAATVLRASASELVALVPPGATTGAISVAVGSQSVSSSTDFIVDQNSRLPTIESFSPLIATAGTQITVNGDSLYPIAHQTTARIGARAGVIGTALSTQLDFVVPTLAASGKVSVSTPYGMAISEQDLVVLPPGVNAADIVSFQRITPDAPAHSFAIQTTGQQVAVLVDATVGEYLDVQFSQISGGGFTYALYDPSNRLVRNGSVYSHEPTLLLPPATSGGTHLLLIRPDQGPASWNLAIERSRKIVPGEQLISVATTVLGQKKRLVFSAALDQRFGVGLEDVVTSDGNGFSAYVMQRDVTATSTYCYPSYVGCGMNVRASQPGTHAIVLSPSSNQTVQTKVTLSDDIRHALQREVPLELTVPRRGQNARLHFTAQAGESLALQVVGQSTQPAGKYVNYGVYRPDGSLLTSFNAVTHQLVNLPSLPQSGEYLVFVDPDQAVGVSSQVLLSTGTGNGGQVDGDSGEHSTSTGGQSVYFNFDVAEVDQRLGIGISDLELSGGSYVIAYVYAPDGSSVASAVCYQERNGCEMNVRAPRVGRYSVVVQPVYENQTMAFRSWVSNDLHVVMTRETPLQLDIVRRGQNARLYIDAQAGETLAVLLAGQSTGPTARPVYYQVYTPEGTLLTSSYATGPEVIRMSSVPVTGRYMLFVDPNDGATLQARATLTQGRQTAMAINGAIGDFVAPIAGHPAFLSFDTTVPDQRLGLAFADIQLSNGSYFSAYVYGPDGMSVTSVGCYASQVTCAANIRATAVGTYSVVAMPQSPDQLMRFKATLSNDLYLPLVREQPLEMAIPRLGQNARLTFSAQAGENLAVQITGQTASDSSGVPYTLYRPDGTYQTAVSPSTHEQMPMMSLPQSGEYFIFVDPYYGATVQARVLLTAGNGGEAVVDEDPADVVTTVGGQATFATFKVDDVDQRLGVAVSDLVMSSGSYASVYVYLPSGGSVVSTTCYASTQGCDLNLRAPEAGTYGLVVIPQNHDQTLAYTVTVSNDLYRTVPRETPITFSLPRRGQNGWLSVAAQAGETLGLQISGQASVPAASYVNYQLFMPDGTWLASRTTADSETINMPTLPVSGEYRVFVDPYYGASMSAQLMLTTGEGSGGQVDGDSGEFASQPGQPTYMTFQAAAGEQLGMGISELTLSSGSYLSVAIYQPGGSTLTGATCYASTDGCQLNINAPTSGTYSMVTVPQSSSQAATFKTTLSRDLKLTLVRNTPLALSIARRGQKARLSFTGEAGDSLALQVTGQTTVPSNRSVYYQVYRPDGSWLTSFSATTYGSQPLRLPMAGTYEVLVETGYGEAVNGRITLSQGGGITVDGEPGALGTGQGGQAAHATFQASAGQSLSLGIHALSVSSGSYVSVAVYRPDGAHQTSTTCYEYYGGCKLSVQASLAGTYALVVTPQSADQTFAHSVSVSTDVVGVLQPDQPLALSVSRPGQSARLTFEGDAGQWLSVQLSGLVMEPTQRTVYYQVYRPDGSYITGSSATTHGALRMNALPVSGTYTVVVESSYGETFQGRLSLATGTSALEVDGAVAQGSTDLGGQEVFLTFSATQGQRLGVGLSSTAISSDSYFVAILYAPDTHSSSAICYPQYGGCELDMVAAVGGVYRLYLQPVSATQKITYTATVSTDQQAPLGRNTLLPVSLPRAGQNGRFSFSGTAGESLRLKVSDFATGQANGSAYVLMVGPDGYGITAVNIYGDYEWPLPALPASGTYHISVNPTYGTTLSAGLTLQ